MTIGQEIEITKLKAELEEWKAQAILEPFVREFLQSIGVVLAQTPMAAWPEFAQTIYEYHRRKSSAYVAQLYESRLPKTKEN